VIAQQALKVRLIGGHRAQVESAARRVGAVDHFPSVQCLFCDESVETFDLAKAQRRTGRVEITRASAIVRLIGKEPLAVIRIEEAGHVIELKEGGAAAVVHWASDSVGRDVAFMVAKRRAHVVASTAVADKLCRMVAVGCRKRSISRLPLWRRW
jgi:uncharacterized protein YkvS